MRLESEKNYLTRTPQKATAAAGWVLLLLTIPFLASQGRAGEAKRDDLIRKAEEAVGRSPSMLFELGLGEMYRAAGRMREASERYNKAALRARQDSRDPQRIREYAAWLLMWSAEGPHPEFKGAAYPLLQQKEQGGWGPVYALYIALQGNDGVDILRKSALGKLPTRFPGALAERAHQALLRETGMDRTRAGLEVIVRRSYRSLHALKDLDRRLTHQAGLLEFAGKKDEALQLQRCRDRLRKCYLDISKHIVERLFALKLAGKEAAFLALRKKTQKLTYLYRPQVLAKTIWAHLTESQVWSDMVFKLLESEVAFVENPPDFKKFKKVPREQLHIQARERKKDPNGNAYRGGVTIEVGHLQVNCKECRVTRKGSEKSVVLSGSGDVRVNGVPGQKHGVSAGAFVFTPSKGQFELRGDVILNEGSSEKRMRSCTLKTSGAWEEPRGEPAL